MGSRWTIRTTDWCWGALPWQHEEQRQTRPVWYWTFSVSRQTILQALLSASVVVITCCSLYLPISSFHTVRYFCSHVLLLVGCLQHFGAKYAFSMASFRIGFIWFKHRTPLNPFKPTTQSTNRPTTSTLSIHFLYRNTLFTFLCAHVITTHVIRQDLPLCRMVWRTVPPRRVNMCCWLGMCLISLSSYTYFPSLCTFTFVLAPLRQFRHLESLI